MSEAEHEGEGEQSFISHLVELRERLLKAVAAVMLVLLALLPFANRLYGWLALPLISHLPQGGTMIATEVASPFLTPLKLAFFVALFVAIPFVLYQLWAFVAPGLYRHEKRLAVPILVSSVILFYIGCAFAYFLVLPAVFTFMTGVAPAGVAVTPDIGRYLDFVLMLFLAFGLCFEVPVVLVILVALGMVTPAQLAGSRRYAIVGAFAVAAVLTPPDPMSQIGLALPAIILYEISIYMARLVERKRAAESASTELEET
jgi:sec-independent protein translocase protein TatC